MNNNRLSFPNGFEKTEVRWEKIKIKLAPNVLQLYAVCALAFSVGKLRIAAVTCWHGKFSRGV